MSKLPPLSCATIEFAGNGMPYSSRYDDMYHAHAGAIGQSQHVFLAGNDLPQRWSGRSSFTILETGFGLGINFLCTWAAWQQDPNACAHLHFISFEKHPFSAADLKTLHALWPELAPLAEQLQQQWPLLTPGFHRLHFCDRRISLTLVLGDALEWLPQLNAEVDAFYLDGFSPSKNPELWSEGLFKQIARLSHPQASCATYTFAAHVRKGLTTAGFTIERRPGFGGKRDMLQAKQTRPKPARFKTYPAKHSIVLGAGIAGTSIAHNLAQRDWDITLIDRQAAPGCESSGNKAGILAPVLSLDDNFQARLSRACLDYTLRHLRQLPATFNWGQPGVLQLALDPENEERQREIIHTLQLPPDFARYVDQHEASTLSGQTMPCGGWWFAQGAWVSPAELCTTQSIHPNIKTRFNCVIGRIERHEQLWQVFDEQDQLIDQAEALILANGCDARKFASQLSITPMRRQVSHIPAEELPALQIVLCREGYLTPTLDGFACLGASRDDQELKLITTLSAHQQNLEKLAQLLPDYHFDFPATKLDGRVGYRPTTPDRLPLVGTIPDFVQSPRGGISQLHQLPKQVGLYGLLGLGARGLTWSALCAELLACQINGEPLPLEKKLVEAIDPARFWLRELRHTN